MTHHLYADNPDDLAEAARLLREGRLVAFATETVYGLGANALSVEAVAGIFRAKQRPAWDPLILHIESDNLLELVAVVPKQEATRVRRLMDAFWPGPLTFLLPRTRAIPDAVTAGRDLVGVRVPAHAAARALLRAAGVPVAAPSANRFGHVSPTTAEHVLADLEGRIDAVLDAGPCRVGVESTVLAPLQTPMVVYRQGAVTAEALEVVSGVGVKVYQAPVASAQAQQDSLPSPGVGLRHYAPRARLVLLEGGPEALRQRALAERNAQRTGVLLPEDWPLGDDDGEPGRMQLSIEPWARWDDAPGRAATLFAALRALDARGVEVIICPLPPPGNLDDAIRDRLEKGARLK